MIIPWANGALKAMPATAGYLAQTDAVDVVTSEKSNQHLTNSERFVASAKWSKYVKVNPPSIGVKNPSPYCILDAITINEQRKLLSTWVKSGVLLGCSLNARFTASWLVGGLPVTEVAEDHFVFVWVVSTFRASLALGALPPVRGDVRQEVKAETRARRMDGRLAFGAPKVKTDTTRNLVTTDFGVVHVS